MNISTKIAIAQEMVALGLIKSPNEYLNILADDTNEYSVEFWVQFPNIDEDIFKRYPNARIAKQIKDSPLFEAMK